MNLLTIKSAALESEFSESYIRKQIREGKLKTIRFGESQQAPVRIERSEFERWLRWKIAGSKTAVSLPNTVQPKKEHLEVF